MTRMDADFLLHVLRLHSRHSDRPIAACFCRDEGRRFLSDGLWIAEPGAGANRAQPLGFALEFLVCSHQVSGRSAWTLGHLALVKILYLENHAVFAEQVTRQFLGAHRVTVVPSLAAARGSL